MNFTMQSSLLIATLALVGCSDFFEKPGTPLADAAHRGDVAAIRTLVAGGADPNAIGPDGGTALHWAARGGHPIGPHRCSEAGDRVSVVVALLDLGADPDIVDRRRTIPGGSSGWTALHVALRHEQFRTATLLLERGADPNILSQQRRSVLAMAAAERAPRELLELIMARGFDAQIARRPPRQ
jgi:uncharacterized protein